MKVVSIAAGCVGLVGVMCATTTLAADVPSSFIQQEAARADASLRQRAEAPIKWRTYGCIATRRSVISN